MREVSPGHWVILLRGKKLTIGEGHGSPKSRLAFASGERSTGLASSGQIGTDMTASMDSYTSEDHWMETSSLSNPGWVFPGVEDWLSTDHPGTFSF